MDATLRAAGHTVTRLAGSALGALLAQALAPLDDTAPVILPDVPLAEQILRTAAERLPSGWTFGDGAAPLTAQVLSLHRAPPRTYPGILSAPRAPQGAEPLALWDAWPGPLSLVVNVAVVDQAQEKARLRTKRTLAFLQRVNPLGDTSPEHAALKGELDTLLTQFFLTGGQLPVDAGAYRAVGRGGYPPAGSRRRGGRGATTRPGISAGTDPGEHALPPDVAAGL
jgi:hypothetical protein